MSMQFITMDLISEFYSNSSAGNTYALTVNCMITGYTFCVPIKTKTASEVQAYIDNIYIPNLKDSVTFDQTMELS